ncbi:hypothetical protein ACFLVF_02875 [Chloroflexota bacterium]
MPIGILYREELREYDFGSEHPFRGDRFDIFPRFLRKNVAEEVKDCHKEYWACLR